MTARTTDRPLRAALFMICAMAVIGVIDNLIAPLSRHIGLWQFHLSRALMAWPLVAMLPLLGLGTLRPRRFWAVALRSACIAVSMLFYFTALSMMPIAQALSGLFTSPIFILLISVLFLRQRIGIWRVLAVAAGFAGILLVLQPDPSELSFATLFPVAAGVFYALGAIVTRQFCTTESTVALLAGMWVMLGLIGAAGTAVLAIWPLATPGEPPLFVTRPWVWPMWEAVPIILAQAVGSVAGVFMIIKAYQLGDPGHVSVFEYSVMIFGPFFAWIAFGQPLGWVQAAGVALIIAAGTVIALRTRADRVTA